MHAQLKSTLRCPGARSPLSAALVCMVGPFCLTLVCTILSPQAQPIFYSLLAMPEAGSELFHNAYLLHKQPP
eukprot:1158582-Pelagomonas_calceolata.AAC.4